MSFGEKMRNFIKVSVGSRNGRNIVLYLIFLCVAFIFWLLLTLNNEVQKDYLVQVNITSIPDSTTIISDIPKYIRVTVKDKGSSLLRYSFGQQPSIQLNFKDYIDNNESFVVTPPELNSIIRDAFASSVTIVSVSPQQLKLKYTTLPGKKIPIIVDANAQTDFRYILSGRIKANVDSALVYSDRETLNNLTEVYTYHFEESNLRDTTFRKVKIATIKGVKVIPSSVELMFPVEPLITKAQIVSVIPKDVPKGVKVLTFPSKIKISYLTALSQHNMMQTFDVGIDYDDINVASTRKIPINIYYYDKNSCKNVSISPDSVDYIIEKN